MSQTSISQDPAQAIAGMMGDGRDRTIESFIATKEGTDATAAVVTSTVDETYDLADGDTLVVRINGVEHTLTVNTADVSNINAVTIAELIALVATDLPGVTGSDASGLRLTSNEVGADESIQIVGGNVQAVLLFPTDEVTGSDGTPTPILFGHGLVTNVSLDDVDEVRSPKASATTNLAFKGVAIYDASKQASLPEVAATAGDYEAEDMVPVMTRGTVWVNVEGAVDESKGVFLRCVATGSEVAGHFRGTADSSDCIDLSTKARWKSRTTGAGLALLELL